MRILFVVGHPAHVHFFKNVVRCLRSRGHEVLVGAVAREVTEDLLRRYDVPHFVFGTSKPSLAGKALDILPKDAALLREAHPFRPDMFVSTGSPYAGHVAAVLGRPHLVFGDTENATIVTRLMLPFADLVCTPAAFQLDLGPKHVRYNGSKELAYLHPRYFRPDPEVLESLGLSRHEPFLLLRFSAWDSSHDFQEGGFRFGGEAEEAKFISELERYGRVLLTSERPVAPRLDAYRVSSPPERLHDLLAFARLYVGEGATMAAEAGVLGVPWIFVSTTGRGFLEEQEHRYRLGHWVSSTADALQRAEMILSQPDVHRRWKAKRDMMLSEKVDVTRFMLEFIEGWPKSFEAARQERDARAAQALAMHPG